jgi:hypothetical protein
MVFNTNVIMPDKSPAEADPVYRLRMAERKLFSTIN